MPIATPDACFAMDASQKQELSFSEYPRVFPSMCGRSSRYRRRRRNTRVSWQLPTSFESLILCAALSRLGARSKIRFFLSIETAKSSSSSTNWKLGFWWCPRIFRGFDHGAMGDDSSQSTRSKLEVLITRRQPSQRRPRGCYRAMESVPDDDPVRWVLYSSGTTADPKGAPSHRRHPTGRLLWIYGAAAASVR